MTKRTNLQFQAQHIIPEPLKISKSHCLLHCPHCKIWCWHIIQGILWSCQAQLTTFCTNNWAGLAGGRSLAKSEKADQVLASYSTNNMWGLAVKKNSLPTKPYVDEQRSEDLINYNAQQLVIPLLFIFFYVMYIVSLIKKYMNISLL